MRGKLLSNGSSGLFSPLIDVVFNSMAAMFIFLIIYIAVVQPPAGITIGAREAPKAVWFAEYDWGISAVADNITYGIDGELPRGLTIDSRTGRIYGIPYAEGGKQKETSIYPVTAWVRDDRGNSDRRNFTIVVDPVAVPFDPDEQRLTYMNTCSRLKDAFTGREYEEVIGAAGGIEPYTLTVEAGQLPPGLRCDNCRLVGIPEKAGFYTFTLSLTDRQNQYGILESDEKLKVRKEYSLQVYEYKPLDVVMSIPELRADKPFEAVFSGCGGYPPYEIAITYEKAALKNAAVKKEDTYTVLSATPAAKGALSIGVQIRDSRENTLSREFFVPVYDPLPEFTITTKDLPVCRVGETFTIALSQEGGFEPVKWSLEGDLPNGIVLKGNQISGRPTERGKYSFRLVAQDAKGNRVVSAPLEMTVRPPVSRLEVFE